MIPVSKPQINESDLQYISNTVKSSYIAGGPELEKFESSIASFCHRKYAVAVSNGTSALLLALQALDLPEGSRILLPQFTIISALYAVKINKLKPVFIEIDKNTWNVGLSSLKKALKSKIEAAVIVETYASSPPVGEITKLLKAEGIKMIEDAAEGFGGSQNGIPFGSFGDLSILSFYGNKLITTGEGGMVLTDNRSLYDRLYSLRNLSFNNERNFIHKNLSGNFRMTNLQAALGLSQFKRINSLYKHRQKLYNLYLKLLKDLDKFIEFQLIPNDISSSFWVFPILLKDKTKITASKLISNLRNAGIESRHFFYPLGEQPCLDREELSHAEVSLKLWKKGLYLPLGNGISVAEVELVCETLRRMLI